MPVTAAPSAQERPKAGRTSAASASSAKSKAKAKPKPAPVLTYEKAQQMMGALVREYAKPSFQRKLHEAWDAAAGDVVEQGKARQATCLAVQGPILKKFGFEASRMGVFQSVQAFNHAAATKGYDDPEGDYRGWLVGWLVNPEMQRNDPDRDNHFAKARGQRVVERREAVRGPAKTEKAEQDTPPTKLVHLNPERTLLYGARMPGERAPSAFLALPDGGAEELRVLMEYLREDPNGPFGGTVDAWPERRFDPAGRWGAWGFDVGAQGKEPLLKADWHSVQKWGPKKLVFVPRFGDLISVRQAPPRLLAFLEAFREVNMDVWNSIVGELEAMKEQTLGDQKDQDFIWLLDTLCQVFRDRGFLGAIEAQVWWGPVRTPTRSHKDGITSLLHLSLTLNGHRTLRVGCFESAWAAAPQPLMYNSKEFRDWQEQQRVEFTGEPAPNQLWRENNVWDDAAWMPNDLMKVGMKTGDVYISSPFVFEHGVMYEQCDQKSPTIALQCRLAFRDAAAATKVNELRDLDMLRVATAVAQCLKRAGDEGRLRVPSLSEVKYWEGRIAKLPDLMAAALAGGRQWEGEIFAQVRPSFKREASGEAGEAGDGDGEARKSDRVEEEVAADGEDWLWTEIGIEVFKNMLEFFGPARPRPGGPFKEEHLDIVRKIVESQGNPPPDHWALVHGNIVAPGSRLAAAMAAQAKPGGALQGVAKAAQAAGEAHAESGPISEAAAELDEGTRLAADAPLAATDGPEGRHAPWEGHGGGEGAGGEARGASAEAEVFAAPPASTELEASAELEAVQEATNPGMVAAQEADAAAEREVATSTDVASLLEEVLPGPVEFEVVHSVPVSVREQPAPGARELRQLDTGSLVSGYPAEGWLRLRPDSPGGGSSSSSSSSCPADRPTLAQGSGWVFVGSRLRARCLEVSVGRGLELRWLGLPTGVDVTYSVEWRPAHQEGGGNVGGSPEAELHPACGAPCGELAHSALHGLAAGGCAVAGCREPRAVLRGLPAGAALQLRAVAHVAVPRATTIAQRLRFPGPWVEAFTEALPSACPDEPAVEAALAEEQDEGSEDGTEALEQAQPDKEALLRALSQLVQDGVVAASELPGAARLFAAHYSGMVTAGAD